MARRGSLRSEAGHLWGPPLPGAIAAATSEILLCKGQGRNVTFAELSRREANSCGFEKKQFVQILRIRPGPLASSLQTETEKPEARDGGRWMVHMWISVYLGQSIHTQQRRNLVNRII